MEMKKLKILCSSMDSQGHINAILGFAKILEQKGHDVIMTLAPGWKSLAEKHGFQFIPLALDSIPKLKDENVNEKQIEISKVQISESKGTNGKDDGNDTTRNGNTEKSEAPNQGTVDLVSQCLRNFRLSPMELVRQEGDDSEFWIPWYDKQFEFDEVLKKVIETVKPDMIVIDFLLKLPCLEKGSTPWAQLWSSNPIMLYHGHCPPASTGFPIESPRELWDEYSSLKRKRNKKVFDHVNSWLISKGVSPYGENEQIMIAESKWINFYTYPDFLDYNDVAPKLPKWVRIDASVRQPDDSEPFKVPECLKDKPGKLIYFSLGSMGSVDLELMKRVIDVCAKSPHRFIVSKGPHHEKIILPDNMWGDRYLNQIAILPHVDLVITHGGNNTLTESLYFGKPMIVMPLFFDQLDNAQRISEKNLGIRIDTYHFKDDQLLDSIEKLINDEPLKKKLESISINLKTSTSNEIVSQLIEKTVSLGRSPFDQIVEENTQSVKETN